MANILGSFAPEVALTTQTGVDEIHRERAVKESLPIEIGIEGDAMAEETSAASPEEEENLDELQLFFLCTFYISFTLRLFSFYGFL
ncbi:hypothetical protein FNV43_RR07378 [Rhamnella rubrinervis]|uniref:Uncharacterized protein n=1 Tax=Rhamnella rubrinervis TaxID=2594499 RepID=A0A8K0MMN2_9ROSA|nr:hypothetical protein FNV43_RR07378 [Rhamnella rubrinervis]